MRRKNIAMDVSLPEKAAIAAMLHMMIAHALKLWCFAEEHPPTRSELNMQGNALDNVFSDRVMDCHCWHQTILHSRHNNESRVYVVSAN